LRNSFIRDLQTVREKYPVTFMSFGTILDDSFSFAKDGVLKDKKRWLLLIVSLIIFPLILGYLVRIYRGETTAPVLKEWWSMFIDGLKLLAVCIVYALPVILLAIAAFLPLISAFISSGALSMDFASMTETQTELWLSAHPEILSAAWMMVLLLLVTLIVGIVITIFSFIGTVRFARTGMMGEAFNFTAILSQIKRMGWFTYIAALILICVIGIIFGIVLHLFSLVPAVGEFLFIIVALGAYPPFILFSGRFSALVYELGEPAPAAELAVQQ
jgi:hypothetical protein